MRDIFLVKYKIYPIYVLASTYCCSTIFALLPDIFNDNMYWNISKVKEYGRKDSRGNDEGLDDGQPQ